MKFKAILYTTVLSALMLAPAQKILAAPVVFKAVSAFPQQVEMTQQFLQFVKKVNSDKALGVHIHFLGGPDVIPPEQQGGAVQNGVVDMTYGPANYYFDKVPEGEALVASTIDASAARRNGGLALLGRIYEKKMHAHLLGWFGSGVQFFHIYTTSKPTFNASTGKIQGNLRIRSVQLYRGLLQGLGVSPVTVQVPNVYTALQRGVVGGVAWPLIGITDLGWNHYLKYRIDPGFFNNTTIVLVNLHSWNSLSKAQRRGLQRLADRFEVTSQNEFARLAARTRATVSKEGMHSVTLTGSVLKHYEALARTVPWTSMQRLHGSHMKALKAHFSPHS